MGFEGRAEREIDYLYLTISPIGFENDASTMHGAQARQKVKKLGGGKAVVRRRSFKEKKVCFLNKYKD